MIKFYSLPLILTVFKIVSSVSINGALTAFEDIVWTAAQSLESHGEACARAGLQPYVPSATDFTWNSTTLSTVVLGKLGHTILPSSASGLSGCCTGSLWCTDDGCFTQNFGSVYDNFGWMRNNTNAVPVYTCIAATWIETGSYILSSANVSEKASIVTLQGNSSYPNNIQIYSQILGQSCLNAETCQCLTCSINADCPVGMGCYDINNDNKVAKFCYRYCESTKDTTCPCGQSCIEHEGDGFFVCTGGAVSCGSAGLSYDTVTTCEPKGLLQQLSSTNLNISISSSADSITDTIGYVYPNGLPACDSNSDCVDDNVCTTDRCVEGTCHNSYESNGCETNEIEVLQQTATFSYLTTTYDGFPEALVPSYTSLLSRLFPDTGTTADRVYTTTVQVAMQFHFLYFGNIVKQFYVGTAGALSFLPIAGCDNDECVYFTSYSNALAVGLRRTLYAARRVFGSNNVYSGLQIAFDSTNRCIHVHFLAPANSSSVVSTIVSLYMDGSIRMTADTAFTTAGNVSANATFSGLWGAYVGGNSAYASFNRLHLVNASSWYTDSVQTSLTTSSSATNTGSSSTAFCTYNTTACLSSSACVTAGSTLEIRWNGFATGPLCMALMDSGHANANESTIGLACSWIGGSVLSNATVITYATLASPFSVLHCPVPSTLDAYISNKTIDHANSSLLSVSLVYTVNGQVIADAGEGTAFSAATLRGLYYDAVSGEIGRGRLMVRYTPSWAQDSFATCGCNPLDISASTESNTCNIESNVCMNETASIPTSTSAGYYDCFGTLYGSAYIDTCNVCVGGYTGIVPFSSCSGGGSGSGISSILTQTVILLLIICCLTFLTSAVSYSLRRMLINRQTQAFIIEHEMAMRMLGGDDGMYPYGNTRGLTPFEIEAMGQIVFGPAFVKELEANKLKQRSPVSSLSLVASPTVTVSVNEATLGASGDATTTTASAAADTSSDSATPATPAATVYECPICLVEIEEGSVCRHLPEPCGHLFHVECIDPWFQQSQACPLCKRSMRAILNGTFDDGDGAGNGEGQSRSQTPRISRHQSRMRQSGPSLRNPQNNVSDYNRSRPVSSTSETGGFPPPQQTQPSRMPFNFNLSLNIPAPSAATNSAIPTPASQSNQPQYQIPLDPQQQLEMAAMEEQLIRLQYLQQTLQERGVQAAFTPAAAARISSHFSNHAASFYDPEANEARPLPTTPRTLPRHQFPSAFSLRPPSSSGSVYGHSSTPHGQGQQHGNSNHQNQGRNSHSSSSDNHRSMYHALSVAQLESDDYPPVGVRQGSVATAPHPAPTAASTSYYYHNNAQEQLRRRESGVMAGAGVGGEARRRSATNSSGSHTSSTAPNAEANHANNHDSSGDQPRSATIGSDNNSTDNGRSAVHEI